ncbi:MAG: SCP2 sterol-binding domain-containing protein [Deltaproteobacteria bacterium]|nr:SCP2 sterol-binding domain-containing protein [Deltaproteobacteria bacterium]
MSKAQLKSKSGPVEVTPRQVLEEALPKALKANEKAAKSIGATFLINIGGDDGGEWTVDLKKVEVRRGGAKNPDVILEMMDNDFSAMTRGKLDVGQATREGRIRISGSPDLVVSLGHLISG